MEIRTKQTAQEFAATLKADDAALFLDLFKRGEMDIIRGHFPAFLDGAWEEQKALTTSDVKVLTADDIAGHTAIDPASGAAKFMPVDLMPGMTVSSDSAASGIEMVSGSHVALVDNAPDPNCFVSETPEADAQAPAATTDAPSAADLTNATQEQ